jgi:hypothetical protein
MAKKIKRVPYVDINGRVIPKLIEWKKKNPDSIHFDSPFEQRGYKLLTEQNIPFIYQPESIQIIKEFKTLGFDGTDVKTIKVRGMVYTPDFYIKDTNIYLELKGFFYEKDKNRYKACQNELNKIGQFLFLVRNDAELKRIVELIKKDYLKIKTNKLEL